MKVTARETLRILIYGKAIPFEPLTPPIIEVINISKTKIGSE